MLTDNQKRLLENKIYGIVKNYLNEWKNSEEAKNERKRDKDKEDTILDWLNDDSVNQAAIAYDIYNAETEHEKAAARSIFYKKAGHKKNDNGVPYEFDETELNNIESAMDNARK